MDLDVMYKLGKSSLQEKKNIGRKILGDLGETLPYISKDVLEDLTPAFVELLIEENIEYLLEESELPGSVKIDFFIAMVKSDRLLISDEALQKVIKKKEQGELR